MGFAAFVLLGAVEFIRQGGFSRSSGGMTVSGHYWGGAAAQAAAQRPGWIRLEGAASVSFGGLEFHLADASGANGGLYIVDSSGNRLSALPQYMILGDYSTIFALPLGVEVIFEARQTADALTELRISARLPEGVAALDIPFVARQRRAAIAWDNSLGILGVTYEGRRHMFSRHSPGLLAGRLALSAEVPYVRYGPAPEVIENNPANFIALGMEGEEAFSLALESWVDGNFGVWGDVAENLAQDRVIALGAEALRRGNQGAAMSAIPAGLSAGAGINWESAVFPFSREVGFWEEQAAAIAAAEERKIALVGDLVARRDYGGLFAENRLLEFLSIRGYEQIIDSIIASAIAIDPAMLTLEASAGILESDMSMGDLRAAAENPFGPLAYRARELVAQGLRRSAEQILVFSENARADISLNLRLGRALREWGERSGDRTWAALGRSLIFSVISLSGADGSVPAEIDSDENGALWPSEHRIDSASLFRMLDENEFLPRAAATGLEGVWAWTTARSIRAAQTTANIMDIYLDFPAGQTHYAIISGLGPFAQIQMHGQNVARNQAFEAAAASGWNYFADTQTLVLKVQHRADVEQVRVIFTAPVAVARAPPPPPPPPPPPATPEEPEGGPSGGVTPGLLRPWTPPTGAHGN